jgi:ABC-type phosphate/phosphonate transport system substrate-binding protein
MFATLQMYDYPEVREATDAWWAAIARHAGVALPLSRPDDYMGAWSREDLLFSQTCGYPFTHHFRGKLTLVGTPCYDVPGCTDFHYCSFVFAREKRQPADYRGLTAAVNTPDSMSGMLALKSFFVGHARDGRFFGKVVLSGGHLKSLALLQQGAADVCAIDAICVAYARRYQPQLLVGLHEIGRTPMVPGLPYVTRDAKAQRWQEAVAACAADPALAEVRSASMIGGFARTVPADYDAILALEEQVERQGGLALL